MRGKVKNALCKLVVKYLKSDELGRHSSRMRASLKQTLLGFFLLKNSFFNPALEKEKNSSEEKDSWIINSLNFLHARVYIGFLSDSPGDKISICGNSFM